jgi:hypothetical protein
LQIRSIARVNCLAGADWPEVPVAESAGAGASAAQTHAPAQSDVAKANDPIFHQLHLIERSLLSSITTLITNRVPDWTTNEAIHPNLH